MGNCCSDVAEGTMAVGGAGSRDNPQAADGPNDALDLFLKSRGYQGLFSQIELSLSATDLRNRDVLSKSDPMAVIYMKRDNGTLEELGRTEVVLNSLNPTWIVKVYITYHFEVVQNLVFCVYDVDTQFHNVDVKMLKLDEQQFLGEASCALSQIVTKSNRSLTLDLVCRDAYSVSTPLQSFGKLTVHAEESISSKIAAEITIRCTELENKDLFSRSDPFLVISKIVESGISIPTCKTEVIKNDLNPTWKPVFLNIQQVGSKDSPLVLECFNFNGNRKHDLIGKTQKSLLDLERLYSSGKGENLFLPPPVGHDHPKVLKSQIFVESFSESAQYTFLDYLSAGCELNFMVAVDFTASNGNPRLPDSLHYIDPSGRPNAYQKAILEVGGVLQFYDSDKRFPAWGFGARPIDGPVSHCFNLNGSSNYCEVDGIQGIMMAYTSALRNVALAGPTLFGPVISSAASIASQSLANGPEKYYVLLIITDGVITDLQETKDAIVKASDLPLSICILGVGGADFKEMEVLDADKGDRLESTTGRVSSRDIVQFVPFRDVQNGEISVAQSLLAELPTQFLSYMRSRGIQPFDSLPALKPSD
ncbi:Protein BONZAI 1 [Dionaea muscipula]